MEKLPSKNILEIYLSFSNFLKQLRKYWAMIELPSIATISPNDHLYELVIGQNLLVLLISQT